MDVHVLSLKDDGLRMSRKSRIVMFAPLGWYERHAVAPAKDYMPI
jgi:hypothetical protein